MTHYCVRLCVGALLLLSSGHSGWAQSYPTRPITIIVPNPGGGGVSDLVPRLLSDDMSATLGQPIVIENRPGAGGTLGSASVARSKPDGYTLLMTVNPPITVNMYLQKNFPYDSKTAFAPVTLAAEAPLFLVVKSSLPVKTVSDLIDYAKRNPGTLSYGSAGVGTGHHIIGEWIKQRTGIDMIHVPYRGSGPIIQDMIGGTIQVGFGTLPGINPAVEMGAVRIVAVAEGKRYSDLPDVPTIAETLPGVIWDAWYGLLAPAGTPKAVIDRLHQATVKALKVPDTIAKFKQQGAVPVGSTPEELQERIALELDRWGKVVPSIGLKPE
jgi:tripartite-type tricarboxylate transporter receptor subunit TctC